MSNAYAMPSTWGGLAHTNQLHTTTIDDLCFHVPTTAPFYGFSDLAMVNSMSNSMASELCLSPSKFKTADAMPYKQETPTISPEQMRFDPEESSPVSYTSSTLDPRHSMSTNSTHFASSSQQSSLTRGSISSQTSHDSQSPPTKQHSVRRRRKIELVDPGSARATYLEKNRSAASKCRGKQKRQQEELVEQARDFERQNKCLKAEVAMLQDGVRELMEIVGQHNDCPDTRLKRYVQREADRLATGSLRTPSLSHPSGRTSIDHNAF